MGSTGAGHDDITAVTDSKKGHRQWKFDGFDKNGRRVVGHIITAGDYTTAYNKAIKLGYTITPNTLQKSAVYDITHGITHKENESGRKRK